MKHLRIISSDDEIVPLFYDCLYYNNIVGKLTFKKNIRNLEETAWIYADGTIYQENIIGELTKEKVYSPFENCPKDYELIGIEIGTNVTNIGNGAFTFNRYRITVFKVDSLEEIDSKIPSNLRRCESGLTTEEIYDEYGSLVKINYYVSIYANPYLEHINISNSVETIGKNSFARCQMLKSIILPNSIIEIGEYAFKDCDSVTSVSIPNSLETIEKCTFLDCDKLKEINIPNSVINIGESAFCGCPLTSVTIPNSVTNIGIDSFRDCTKLTSIAIPNSVTTIGYRAFMRCSCLASVTYNGNSYTSKSELITALTNNGVTVGVNVFYETALRD